MINNYFSISVYSVNSPYYDLKKFDCETIYSFIISYYDNNSIVYYYDFDNDEYEQYLDTDGYTDGPYRTDLNFKTVVNIIDNVIAKYPNNTEIITKISDCYVVGISGLTQHDINDIRARIHNDIDWEFEKLKNIKEYL